MCCLTRIIFFRFVIEYRPQYHVNKPKKHCKKIKCIVGNSVTFKTPDHLTYQYKFLTIMSLLQYFCQLKIKVCHNVLGSFLSNFNCLYCWNYEQSQSYERIILKGQRANVLKVTQLTTMHCRFCNSDWAYWEWGKKHFDCMVVACKQRP